MKLHANTCNYKISQFYTHLITRTVHENYTQTTRILHACGCCNPFDRYCICTKTQSFSRRLFLHFRACFRHISFFVLLERSFPPAEVEYRILVKVDDIRSRAKAKAGYRRHRSQRVEQKRIEKKLSRRKKRHI